MDHDLIIINLKTNRCVCIIILGYFHANIKVTFRALYIPVCVDFYVKNTEFIIEINLLLLLNKSLL